MNKFDYQDAMTLLHDHEKELTEDEKTLCSLVLISFTSNERMDKEDVEPWRLLQSKLTGWSTTTGVI